MLSVCMATHNGEKYVEEQLRSILSQLGSDDEVVVSDDGSTDRTISIIESLNDKRIRIFSYKPFKKYSHTHIMVSRNYENALKHTQGDYIFLSDQDDIWVEKKVEECMKHLKDNQLIVHDMQFIDNRLNKIGGGIMVPFISRTGNRQARPIMAVQWHLDGNY